MTCMRIITEEAHKNGFLVSELLSYNKKFKLMRTRAKAMYRCRHELKAGDGEIAYAFKRDRTSIRSTIYNYALKNELPVKPPQVKLLVTDKMLTAAAEALGFNKPPRRLIYAIDAAIRVKENA